MAEEDSGEERGEGRTPLEKAVAGGVTFVTLAVAFGLLALGNPYFWVAFPVGFGGGMPLAVGLARWYESRADDRGARDSGAGRDDADEALAALRDRYARGELTDEEFEARVERLLETESVPDAKSFAARERAGMGTGDASGPTTGTGIDPGDGDDSDGERTEDRDRMRERETDRGEHERV